MNRLRKTVDSCLARRRQHLLYLGRSEREAEHNAAALAQDFALKRVLIEHKINCVVDIGANIGQFAKRLRSIGYEGRIASVEPSAESHAQLCRNMASDAAWQGFHFAAGAERGTAELNILASSVLNSLSIPNADALARIGATAVTVGRQSVEVFPLDGVWDDLLGPMRTDPRVFLKTDTQGFDHAVLAGAAGRALPAASVLQLEVAVERLYEHSRDWKQTLEELAEQGWAVVGLYPAAHDQRTGTVMEFDCLMTASRGQTP